MNYSSKTVKTKSTKGFLELTRPLLVADTNLLIENIVMLEMKALQSIGTLSDIVRLQQNEIINEIALRN